MNLTLRNTFAKVATITYCLGTTAHIIGVIFTFPFDQMPILPHAIVAVLSGYAGLGYILHSRKIKFKGVIDKIVYGLILFHLTTSALMHTYSIVWNTNDWLHIFKPSYSYFAVIYFALFAGYSYRLDKRVRA